MGVYFTEWRNVQEYVTRTQSNPLARLPHPSSPTVEPFIYNMQFKRLPMSITRLQKENFLDVAILATDRKDREEKLSLPTNPVVFGFNSRPTANKLNGSPINNTVFTSFFLFFPFSLFFLFFATHMPCRHSLTISCLEIIVTSQCKKKIINN